MKGKNDKPADHTPIIMFTRSELNHPGDISTPHTAAAAVAAAASASASAAVAGAAEAAAVAGAVAAAAAVAAAVAALAGETPTRRSHSPTVTWISRRCQSRISFTTQIFIYIHVFLFCFFFFWFSLLSKPPHKSKKDGKDVYTDISIYIFSFLIKETLQIIFLHKGRLPLLLLFFPFLFFFLYFSPFSFSSFFILFFCFFFFFFFFFFFLFFLWLCVCVWACVCMCFWNGRVNELWHPTRNWMNPARDWMNEQARRCSALFPTLARHFQWSVQGSEGLFKHKNKKKKQKKNIERMKKSYQKKERKFGKNVQHRYFTLPCWFNWILFGAVDSALRYWCTLGPTNSIDCYSIQFWSNFPGL